MAFGKRTTPVGRDEPVLMANEAELDRLIHASLEAGRERLNEYKATLLAQHGCDDVRAFFIFAEIMGTPLGAWMIMRLKLGPYDAWNTIYLPTTPAMARALGLPLHPQRNLPEFDSYITKFVTKMKDDLAEAEKKALADTSNANIPETLVAYWKLYRDGIIKYADKWRPLIIDHLAKLPPAAPGAAS